LLCKMAFMSSGPDFVVCADLADAADVMTKAPRL